MIQYATVIEVEPIWTTQHAPRVLRLELPNGKRTSVPVGLTVAPGDRLIVIPRDEWERRSNTGDIAE